jgi:undecaprenyl-diphosphatase
MESSLPTVILLGAIEGLTEFLPVSSTGHLILAARLLGFTGEASSSFKIAIQLGAILAVLVAYRHRFGAVLVGLGRKDPGSIAFTRNILLAFLPAMVVGVFAYSSIKAALENPLLVAVALIVGGIAILVIERLVKHPRFHSVESFPWPMSVKIGIVQCLAMIPGVSRSGATIMGSLLMGVERKTAAEFSFFLAVPTMAAATAYDLWKSRHALDFSAFGDIAIGFTVAFIVALLVVKAFVALVSRYGFAPFAWYRIIIGSVALYWLM